MATAVDIIAAHMHRADLAVAAAEHVGVDLALLCAVIESESAGRHVYGNDSGGLNSTPGTPDIEVTHANYFEFEQAVLNGAKPNGVGIMQITYAGPLRNGKRDGGFLREAREQGLLLSDPYDNIVFGAGLLRSYVKGRDLTESVVVEVGKRYNGAESYGRRLWTRYLAWRDRLAAAEPEPEPAPEPAPTPDPTPDEAGNEDSGIDVAITDRDGGMVTRYVAVAEVIEPDGVESLRVRMSPGLAEWDALGMLHFTTARTASIRDA